MNDRITIRIRSDVRDALDRFHREQVPYMVTKQDAFRHIIEDWLVSRGYLPLSPEKEYARQDNAARSQQEPRHHLHPTRTHDERLS